MFFHGKIFFSANYFFSPSFFFSECVGIVEIMKRRRSVTVGKSARRRMLIEPRLVEQIIEMVEELHMSDWKFCMSEVNQELQNICQFVRAPVPADYYGDSVFAYHMALIQNAREAPPREILTEIHFRKRMNNMWHSLLE
jgi:hypothetical protein